MNTIRAIETINHDNQDEANYWFCRAQNSVKANCSKIEKRKEFYGDHGIDWFDIYDDAGFVIASVSHRCVAIIYYMKEGD